MTPSIPDDAARFEALDAFSHAITRASYLHELVDICLDGLGRWFGHGHVMLLLADDDAGSLYVIGSAGYEVSGVGAEVPYGLGVIGTAARERRTTRLDDATRELAAADINANNARRVGMPRLASPGSQVAAPLLDGETALGVLFVEHPDPEHIPSTQEAVINVVARQAGLRLALLTARSLSFPSVTATFRPQLVSGRLTVVTYYAEDESVVIAGDFAIRGLAGAVLWRLLTAYVEAAASASPADLVVELPPMPANSETLLVLLSRRLRDGFDFIRLTPIGRGSFMLEVSREITLLEVPR